MYIIKAKMLTEIETQVDRIADAIYGSESDKYKGICGLEKSIVSIKKNLFKSNIFKHRLTDLEVIAFACVFKKGIYESYYTGGKEYDIKGYRSYIKKQMLDFGRSYTTLSIGSIDLESYAERIRGNTPTVHLVNSCFDVEFPKVRRGIEEYEHRCFMKFSTQPIISRAFAFRFDVENPTEEKEDKVEVYISGFSSLLNPEFVKSDMPATKINKIEKALSHSLLGKLDSEEKSTIPILISCVKLDSEFVHVSKKSNSASSNKVTSSEKSSQTVFFDKYTRISKLILKIVPSKLLSLDLRKTINSNLLLELSRLETSGDKKDRASIPSLTTATAVFADYEMICSIISNVIPSTFDSKTLLTIDSNLVMELDIPIYAISG